MLICPPLLLSHCLTFFPFPLHHVFVLSLTYKTYFVLNELMLIICILSCTNSLPIEGLTERRQARGKEGREEGRKQGKKIANFCIGSTHQNHVSETQHLMQLFFWRSHGSQCRWFINWQGWFYFHIFTMPTQVNGMVFRFYVLMAVWWLLFFQVTTALCSQDEGKKKKKMSPSTSFKQG